MPLRVLIAEDQRLIGEGFSSLLRGAGFDVVGEATDGHEAIRLSEQLRPDVAVLDISMPGLNGIDAARAIQRSCPDTKTLIVTMHSDDAYVVDALRAGIGGYVLKSQAGPDLVSAINQVVQGNVYLSPGISGALANAVRSNVDVPEDPLTPREREVLQLVAEGMTSKEVSNMLHVSPKTVDAHRASIMRKLDLHDTAGLVRYAIRRGLIEI
ncbi:MAG: DNA-binding response regulator [Acidobacteria bacterium]|nr:MAG: DNA-binding response regulator [Acidobacteriota bacterium]